MPEVLPALIGAYVVGVLWGVVATDGPPTTRLALSLLWPLGPVAFVLTVTMLLLVAPVALIRRKRA